MNREEWLTKLSDELRPLYLEHGADVPEKIRITCGWPSRKAFSLKSRRVGECWNPKASGDGTAEVFISPCVSDSLEASGILAHEIIHAIHPEAGHKGAFKRVAQAIGLEGKMTSTTVGSTLRDRLNAVIKDLGTYPHATLDRLQSPHKKDGTRMIKLACVNCGYTVRTTQKWIDQGLPVCPCGETLGL